MNLPTLSYNWLKSIRYEKIIKTCLKQYIKYNIRKSEYPSDKFLEINSQTLSHFSPEGPEIRCLDNFRQINTERATRNSVVVGDRDGANGRFITNQQRGKSPRFR